MSFSKKQLISFAMVALFISGCSDGTQTAEFTCSAASDFRVKVGEHEFAIPRGLEPNIFPADDSKKRFSEEELCQDSESPSLLADRFSFSFQDDTAVDVPNEFEAIVDQISPVQLIIEKRPAVDRPVSLGFLLEDLEKKGTSYESLVFHDSLYCFNPAEADTLMCISSPEFLSPRMHPIAYSCGKERSVSRDGEIVNIGRLCIGNYFLSADLMLTVRVYDKWQPKERWRSHDASIREFLNLIESPIP